MRIQLLGGVQGVVGDRPVSLGVRKQRFVMALLALEVKQLVPVSRLVDLIWAEQPPASARRMIHTYVSGLRAILDNQEATRHEVTLRGEPGGYQLRCDPMRIDCHRFRDLVTRARLTEDDEARVLMLDEALGLWHGPALAGLCGEDVRIRLCHHLEEARLAAYEDRGEALLQLGRHHDLIDEHSVLSGQHPHRQRLTAQLMRALHRTGLTAQALQIYGRTRASLSEELGIDPGPELQRLYQAILCVAPELPVLAPSTEQRVPKPAQLPAATRHFVGRTAEIKELTRLLDSAADAAVVISAIDGTAGIGKTALALHWAHRMASRFPDGQLYVNLRGFDPNGSEVAATEAVRGFLDAFDVPPQRIPATLPAKAALYRSLLSNRKVLVLIDNARNAEQVRPLLPGTPGCLVLVTSRSRLTSLVAVDGAQPVTLAVLSTVDARELLARRIGADRVAADGQATDEIITRCARLPLALATVAARAAARPDFPLAALADELRATRGSLDAFHDDDPATDLRTVFSWSYQRLSTRAGRLFRLLSLHHGPDLAAPAAASLAGVAPGQELPLLAELTRAHLITEPTPARYSFHDLLRTYASELIRIEDTGTERQDALRRLLDHYLHTAHTAARVLSPHRIAITPVPAEPGAASVDLASHEQAMAWFTTERSALIAAVHLAAGNGFGAHSWQLAWTMVEFLDRRGHWTEWINTQTTALYAARQLGDREGQAHAHRGLGRALARTGRHNDAHRHLLAALELFGECGHHIGQARTHLDLSSVLGLQDRHHEALRHALAALARYESAGHRNGQARALNAVGWDYALLGDHEQAISHCERALALHQQDGDHNAEAATWDSLGYVHDQHGHHRQAISCYQHALALRHDVGDRLNESDALTKIGDVHRAAGDPEAARNAWKQAVQILDELHHPNADQVRAKANLAGGDAIFSHRP